MSPEPPHFAADVTATGGERIFSVTGPARDGSHRPTLRAALAGGSQQDYLDLFARLAATFGSRMPSNRQARKLPECAAWHRPLLVRNIDPRILYGYGDPCVVRAEEDGAWYMVVTSNDAPDAFPILRSADLWNWELVDFVFPAGRIPAWAAQGSEVGDFWAPELHRVGDGFVVCFCARQWDGTMAIGMARAASPAGPFSCREEPLLQGGVIDAHLFDDGEGGRWLVWKDDTNGIWPRLLAQMLADDPALSARLFDDEADRRTAALTGALWPWGERCPPMEQFFLLQPLIESVTDLFDETRKRLAALSGPRARAVLAAMQTPIRARRLSDDLAALTGEASVLITNDLPWEGHLIEGPWLTARDGRFYLFYAGNDFTNSNYGIGAAVAESAFGPFTKMREPLIRSDAGWAAPGHPSVAPGPDGRPQLFYHAYPPGEGGYKAFRAVLTCGLEFGPQAIVPVPTREGPPA